MDLRRTVAEYVTLGRELVVRLRSVEEGPTVPIVDLQILRVQMFLIDNAAANLLELKRQHPSETATTKVDEEMSRLKEPFLSSKIMQSHSVQFYHDDTFMTESVARFITEGLQANETVMVVATAQHCEDLHKVLTSRERTHDKLRFLDAREQLSTFMVDGWPNGLRFKNGIGGIIDQASKHGPVRVFGEMVAILWAEGNVRGALRLEELWNSLMEEHTFALLCAYPLTDSSKEKDNDSLLAISRLHTHSHTQSTLAQSS